MRGGDFLWNYRYSDDYLMHFGILGQKWGVRNYQYKDGTLTPEGKIRYSQSANGSHKAARNVRRDLNKLDNKWAKSDYKYTTYNFKANRLNAKITKKQDGIATEKQKKKLSSYEARAKESKKEKQALERKQLAIIREAAKNNITVLGAETTRDGWEWYKTVGVNLINIPVVTLQAVAGSPIIWFQEAMSPQVGATQFTTYTSDQQKNYAKQKQLYKNFGIKNQTSYGNKTKWR